MSGVVVVPSPDPTTTRDVAPRFAGLPIGRRRTPPGLIDRCPAVGRARTRSWPLRLPCGPTARPSPNRGNRLTVGDGSTTVTAFMTG